MKRYITILAQTLCILCHPLWMVSYGLALFSYAPRIYHILMPVHYPGIAVLLTVGLTAVLPLIVMLIMRAAGAISSLYIDNPKERSIPYLVTAICYVVWLYLMARICGLPPVIVRIGQGAVIALCGVAIINRWWKISAHLTAWGGLIGGVITFSLATAWNLTPLLAILLGVALLLMYARLWLDAHTPAQVVAGLLWGIVSTCLPSLIYAYA